ncbi:hypothetical protein [uncultured Chitinophaga sp.]|nr:hypothetical protein [uncultured Chitinophaga sp.]
MTTKDTQHEKPPLFSKWRYWYLLVIAWLITQIILFYFFTKTFS